MSQMLKTKSVTGNLVSPLELNQRLNKKTLMLSSQQLGWNGILVEQYLINRYEFGLSI